VPLLPAASGADFWQFNLYGGYRFPRNIGDITIGLLNLTNRDYHLNPLNEYAELPRSFTVSVQNAPELLSLNKLVSHRSRWIAISLIVAVVALVWWLPRHPSLLRQLGGATSAKSSEAKATDQRNAQNAKAKSDRLRSAVAELKANKDPAKSRAILAELRKLLDSLPPNIASQLVQEFLKSGQDAGTKLDITIKSGGGLGDASSLRVFLLDYLGQIDRPAAGQIAMQVLSGYTTPDEWAVCLRNFAWANPDAAAYGFLDIKARELLANTEWRKDPSVGYLEAFDTIVYAHATDLTPELATLLRDKDNRATAHAAYLTMDRLTISDPATMLKQIISNSDLMKGREQTRADFVARADIRQPDQRALVEQYLLDPGRSQQELNTFAATYPNANYMISTNLLTEVKTPGAGELQTFDRQALEVVGQWENDPRFEPILPVLGQMRARLEDFVKQADRAAGR
jgi:hypothetical protein